MSKIKLLFMITAVIGLISCSTIQPYRSADIVVPQEAGTWSGLLRCDRYNHFNTRLTIWETAPDKFTGKMRLDPVKGDKVLSEYPISGSRHQYGSLILSPDFSDYKRPEYDRQKHMIGISARIDPESRKIVASIRTGCHATLRLDPVMSDGLVALATKYGKYTAKDQKKHDTAAKRKNALAECAARSGQSTGSIARYRDQNNPLAAPAFKEGLFVYQHKCLAPVFGRDALIYSKTAPDAQGDFIEVHFGPLDKGTRVSRREVSIMSLSQMCRVFDYNVVGGRKIFCEPYGWQYTKFVKERCLGFSGAAAALGALRCQLMVMGQAVNAFERGPKQVSDR